MTVMDDDLVPSINNSFDIDLPVTLSPDELKQKLAQHIDYMITHDFEKLIYHLYRIDVNEAAIRQLLDLRKGENASGLIADLIIDRQLNKIQSRKETKSDPDIPEDEKW